jgi:hypothetical protein
MSAASSASFTRSHPCRFRNERMFFFEKKNQKTSAPWPAGVFISVVLSVKVFAEFFSKKRPLT